MVVDNHTMMREGLCALIGQQSDMVVVAQAATVWDGGTVDVIPDVIVIDIDRPDDSHGEAIDGLRRSFPHSPILVLTLGGPPAIVQSVLAAGANGYLLKTAGSTDLLFGIRALAAGQTYLQAELGVELARWAHRDATAGLSPKEEKVLRLLALGYTNAEIARLSLISVRTVETHRGRIIHKLGRRRRADLLAYAREVGLVELRPQ